LFQLANLAGLGALVDGGKVWVKAPVEAQPNRNTAGVGFFPQPIHALDVQVDGLLAESRDSRVDRLVDQVNVCGSGGRDNHQFNVTRAEKAFGVVGGFATKLSGDALGGFQKDVSHPMKDSVGVSVHASRVNIADAARADKSYPKLLGHVASCACLF
jgi:hypothetical protein